MFLKIKYNPRTGSLIRPMWGWCPLLVQPAVATGWAILGQLPMGRQDRYVFLLLIRLDLQAGQTFPQEKCGTDITDFVKAT